MSAQLSQLPFLESPKPLFWPAYEDRRSRLSADMVRTWVACTAASLSDPSVGVRARNILAHSTGWAPDLVILGPSSVVDPTHGADLKAALDDLADVRREALEERFEPPSAKAIETAERLLRAMYTLRPQRFEVYPTQEGEVDVSASGGRGRSVILVCDSAGGALCSVNLNGRHRRAVYDPVSAAALPDGFVRDALAELDVRT